VLGMHMRICDPFCTEILNPDLYAERGMNMKEMHEEVVC